jgi:hypothetical protein
LPLHLMSAKVKATDYEFEEHETRVLFIDDVKFNVEMGKHVLKEFGCNVVRMSDHIKHARVSAGIEGGAEPR